MQLADSTVGSISEEKRSLVVHFAPAHVIKSEGVPAVDASTLWKQDVDLVFGGGDIKGIAPDLPVVIKTGKIAINNMSYIDLMPVPLESAGFIALELEFVRDATKLRITGSDVKLDLLGNAKYIQHIPTA